MDQPSVTFRDRRDGGRRLVDKLRRSHATPSTIVLGLPRGGVVPAAEIAAALGLPLGVVISRKIGAPENPEFAIGAVAEDGAPYLSEEGLALSRASKAYVDEEVARQRAEIARRRGWFRGGKPLVLPEHATVILVDDGIATGATVIAAIRALRQLQVARIVLAVPVAPPDTVTVLRGLVDELVVLATPAIFWAVGAFYDDFRPVTDEEVRRLLAAAAPAATRSNSAPRAASGGHRERTPSSTVQSHSPRATSKAREMSTEQLRVVEVTIPADEVVLSGVLGVPRHAEGIVVFAHGSGSGRLSPRNTYVADVLRRAGLATLLLDLLTDEEAKDRRKVFDVSLLAERLRAAAAWVRQNETTKALALGYFGASTGAAAALIAAAADPSVCALVSRGGRPDLAGSILPRVTAPTLLIVGGADDIVIRLNEEAFAALHCEKRLQIVPGAGHLFEEPGTLDQVAHLAAGWFERHLRAANVPRVARRGERPAVQRR